MWTTLEVRNIVKNSIDQCLNSTKYIMCLTSTNDIMSSILFLGPKSNVNQAGIGDQTKKINPKMGGPLYITQSC